MKPLILQHFFNICAFKQEEFAEFAMLVLGIF